MSCYRRWMNKFSKMKVHWWTYNHYLFVSYLTSVALGYGWISDTNFQKLSDKDWIWIFKKFIGSGSGVKKSTSAHLWFWYSLLTIFYRWRHCERLRAAEVCSLVMRKVLFFAKFQTLTINFLLLFAPFYRSVSPFSPQMSEPRYESFKAQGCQLNFWEARFLLKFWLFSKHRFFYFQKNLAFFQAERAWLWQNIVWYSLKISSDESLWPRRM